MVEGSSEPRREQPSAAPVAGGAPAPAPEGGEQTPRKGGLFSGARAWYLTALLLFLLAALGLVLYLLEARSLEFFYVLF